ncbi:hypothetical protein AGMMS4956_03730 [Bacteroidia bacterium]|nr:hypothetical protein AGMMS4956_03730 [Bacteroidia bacterium]
MVLVQGGTFDMGCTTRHSGECDDDEFPLHSVTVGSFYIGKYPVTQAQWTMIMDSNPSNWQGDSLPVEKVSWDDVKIFIRKLNAATGKKYRLPTEAEWEFAARGGNQSNGYNYAGSNKPADVAWYTNNSDGETHIVGTKKPNELGIYDMSGNVYEWCSDWYEDTYFDNPQHSPVGASSGNYRVYRGGGWTNNARSCRIANRSKGVPGKGYSNLGFRLAHP